MRKTILQITLLLVAGVLALTGCKDDAYDGLQDIDPVPANAVTFPDATQNGFTNMDDNAFIIFQNSVASGRVDVRIKGPDNKNITALEVKAQRFRGAIAAPNISPTVPGGTAGLPARAPGAFGRTAATLEKVNVTPASEVTYSLNLNSLPAALTKPTLGAVQAPAGATPQYDVFRFFFVVTYDDGSTMVSNEVRVVVQG
jgi:hypothetical protein